MAADASGIPIEISVAEVKALRDAGEPLLLLDCREHEEVAIARIEQTMHIPMNEIPTRVGELVEHRHARLIVHCHHGGRSLMVARWLREQGYEHAQNMTGGIDAWTVSVDSTVPRY